MYETEQEIEKVILVAVCSNPNQDPEESLDELEELVKTAGATVVGRMVQNLEHASSATYIGSGKVEELKDLIWETEATAVVCDDELTPAQYKNLEDELDVKVMDRTLIILDIFAGRAKTAEGKIQVELAQLRYRSTRLIGMRNLSRQGGGIGTRGPGEKKLEVDRRLIRDRISQLKSQVEDLESHRQVTRSRRQENPVPVIAIVGYTNAGKSTLLNTLTDARVLEEDKLFATLDPTTRNYKLPDGQEVLLTDTVGFIRKLPHHLIDAFRSTLEEAKYSDITTCNGGEGTDWNVIQNWSGTYGGDVTKYGKELSQKNQLLNGEYGAWRSIDLHTEPGEFEVNGVWSESRMCQLMETKIRLAEQAKDSVCGQFQWIFSSHDNPGRRQPDEAFRKIDKVGPFNYKGLVTPWEEPLDVYYMYRANYVPAAKDPMVYLVSHTWADRFEKGRRRATIEA